MTTTSALRLLATIAREHRMSSEPETKPSTRTARAPSSVRLGLQVAFDSFSRTHLHADDSNAGSVSQGLLGSLSAAAAAPLSHASPPPYRQQAGRDIAEDGRDCPRQKVLVLHHLAVVFKLL